eukprot:Phypoly_transcript_05660.p1 GENE.Phypoly_transcript_05660~~Phypoly_transcript_05660.p1  ORF type:complete len:572 (+),score=70.57 Phypoly_transcript_05660:255-1718(+)
MRPWHETYQSPGEDNGVVLFPIEGERNKGKYAGVIGVWDMCISMIIFSKKYPDRYAVLYFCMREVAHDPNYKAKSFMAVDAVLGSFTSPSEQKPHQIFYMQHKVQFCNYVTSLPNSEELEHIFQGVDLSLVHNVQNYLGYVAPKNFDNLEDESVVKENKGAISFLQFVIVSTFGIKYPVKYENMVDLIMHERHTAASLQKAFQVNQRWASDPELKEQITKLIETDVKYTHVIERGCRTERFGLTKQRVDFNIGELKFMFYMSHTNEWKLQLLKPEVVMQAISFLAPPGTIVIEYNMIESLKSLIGLPSATAEDLVDVFMIIGGIYENVKFADIPEDVIFEKLHYLSRDKSKVKCVDTELLSKILPERIDKFRLRKRTIKEMCWGPSSKENSVLQEIVFPPNGSVKYKEIAKNGSITRSLFSSNKVYRLYTGAQVMLWYGKDTHLTYALMAGFEKAAEKYARTFSFSPFDVVLVFEGSESADFIEFFN